MGALGPRDRRGPPRPGRLRRLAAALGSPAATVWLLCARPASPRPGVRSRCPPRTSLRLLLPAEDEPWAAAADALRAYVTATAACLGADVTAAVDAYADAAAAAYRSPPEVADRGTGWTPRSAICTLPLTRSGCLGDVSGR